MKRLDSLIATQKTRTHFEWSFLRKWDLTNKKVQKSLTLFEVCLIFSKLVMLIRCLKAYMKWLDPLSSMQKKLVVFFLYHFGKNLEKLWNKRPILFGHFGGKNLFFSKTVHQNEFFFLHCNQCIKTLHLSHQTALSNDFHFSKGGPSWFRRVRALPKGDGLVKNVFLELMAFPMHLNVRAKTIPKFGFWTPP